MEKRKRETVMPIPEQIGPQESRHSSRLCAICSFGTIPARRQFPCSAAVFTRDALLDTAIPTAKAIMSPGARTDRAFKRSVTCFTPGIGFARHNWPALIV